MKLFQSYCLHASTADLQNLQQHLNAVYEMLAPFISQHGTYDFPCLFWEAISALCLMVFTELEYREEGQRRARERAEKLLQEESARANTASAPAAQS